MDYRGYIIRKALDNASEQNTKSPSATTGPLAKFGPSMIKVEVPRRLIHKFQDEYKIISHMGNFDSWDASLDKYVVVLKNPNTWDMAYRLYFNPTPEQLESLESEFGDRILQIGAFGYKYRFSDNAIIKNLIRDGAHLGIN